jgi:hypothetical protein
MNEIKNKVDYLKYELDGMNTIGILDGSFFYESENYSGDVEETKIPIENINRVEFKEKKVNQKKTKGNLISNFLWTILDSGAHPTQIEYDKPELTIHFRNENGVRKDTLKIKNRNLTEKIHKEIESKINKLQHRV